VLGDQAVFDHQEFDAARELVETAHRLAAPPSR